MRRRDFIKVVVGSTAAWPFTALAQQSERMRRIGVLAGLAENDPEMQADLTAFREGLQKLGWTDGRNVQIDYRWSAGDAERTRKNVAEIVALAPDVVLAAAAAVGPLLQASRTVPIAYLCWPLIRSATVSSTAWRTRAVTPPVLHCSNMVSAENGWSC